MKILYVITKSNFGGAQRYVYELATAMKDRGHEVVVAFGGNGILNDKLKSYGIETRSIPSFERDIHLLKEIRSFRELWQLYKTERPDVVHLNSSKAGGSGALVARLAGVGQIVYTTHGWAFLEPRSLLWRTLVWFTAWITALLSHRVILVSEYEARHTKMPFVQHKLTVIHTAVPKIEFKSRNEARQRLFSKEIIELHETDLWVITNAELNHNKNLFMAIDAISAFNNISSQKIFYAIMSDGELRDALQRYVSRQHAEHNITLLGYVDDGRTFLNAFDMFLLPSKKEGLPYALLEAGAAGLPVIGSRVGGIPEIIEDKKEGLLIDPNNTESVIEALRTLADDPEKRSAFGKSLQEKIAAEFTLERMVEETEQRYLRSK